jgi:hypothetical protein
VWAAPVRAMVADRRVSPGGGGETAMTVVRNAMKTAAARSPAWMRGRKKRGVCIARVAVGGGERGRGGRCLLKWRRGRQGKGKRGRERGPRARWGSSEGGRHWPPAGGRGRQCGGATVKRRRGTVDSARVANRRGRTATGPGGQRLGVGG